MAMLTPHEMYCLRPIQQSSRSTQTEVYLISKCIRYVGSKPQYFLTRNNCLKLEIKSYSPINIVPSRVLEAATNNGCRDSQRLRISPMVDAAVKINRRSNLIGVVIEAIIPKYPDIVQYRTRLLIGTCETTKQ
ncbi:hypothetical protein POM88_036183 [Heracleum sosnowskyi]|uniref:Uncharacterized protein n=1 Tax=Heracleum sosnowskyi TaxID=360622 RepID=A0AAD8HNT9_9APIA|nr:hypothetical protein POM88_036183 [Heracleum sosnowskyi]